MNFLYWSWIFLIFTTIASRDKASISKRNSATTNAQNNQQHDPKLISVSPMPKENDVEIADCFEIISDEPNTKICETKTFEAKDEDEKFQPLDINMVSWKKIDFKKSGYYMTNKDASKFTFIMVFVHVIGFFSFALTSLATEEEMLLYISLVILGTSLIWIFITRHLTQLPPYDKVNWKKAFICDDNTFGDSYEGDRYEDDKY